MINHAMFQRNMRLGYVLKPKALRAADKAQLTERREHFFDITVRWLLFLCVAAG